MKLLTLLIALVSNVVIGFENNGSVRTELDWVFILDVSATVSESGFGLMTFFVKDFLLDADNDGGKVRVGVIIHSDADYIQFHMNAHSKKQDVYDAIDNIQDRPGSTNTADALKATRSVMFTPQNGDRSRVDYVAVFLTDGVSNINSRKTVPEAEQTRAGGIHIYCSESVDLVYVYEVLRE